MADLWRIYSVFGKGLSYLHGVRHLVHRDIKPANLLVNLKGESKITDFGTSAGLEDSMEMCATFVGTVTYMSAERIRNERYSYRADIWSLGLSLFECAAAEFPYSANEGPVNLMLQMFTIHHYLLFDGSDDLWHHIKTFYQDKSIFSFGGKEYVGPDDILPTLTSIRSTLAGEWPSEKLQCRTHGQNGVDVRVTGSFIIGNQFLICGDGVQVEGLPIQDLSIDIPSKRMGTFQEQFTVEASDMIGAIS